MLKTIAASLPTKLATIPSSSLWSAVVPRSERDDAQPTGHERSASSTGPPHVDIQSSANPR